ncbi:SOS response-associated peptidase family protein [Jeongeupia naejangsanensis]|uniref:Abasic site processing protein n=2 Tax=Jeongeupia naejangsanensis TaxID=613195 RepID=A0ABS2BF61_9NEIS|nr:SOS response-associated peptidase family protein [Jeongeupia naejangsanensis]
MCVNFTPTPPTVLPGHFHTPDPLGDWKDEVWQDYLAPIIIHDESGRRQALLASYGMVPKQKIPPGTKPFSTMNARSETVDSKRSYRTAWLKGYRCLVPMTAFFEPCYESGKAERMRIGMADGAPFAVAGLWRPWKAENGAYTFSFTQLTINADQHALMRRMHRPDDEKRSLVIVPEADYDLWLNCADPAQARGYLRDFPADRMLAVAPDRQQQPLFGA